MPCPPRGTGPSLGRTSRPVWGHPVDQSKPVKARGRKYQGQAGSSRERFALVIYGYFQHGQDLKGDGEDLGRADRGPP